ncbi:MAG: Uma2 family endonuclease [Anaerolineae bacterium]|nr:Uma2 family endonuclease [Anaerolineae bacterium]
MTDTMLAPGMIVASDSLTILAANVSAEVYMEKYAEPGCEWVAGVVYKMAPVGLRHENIRDYLRDLLRIYFAFNPIGQVRGEPFVMRLPAVPECRREPDLLVVLHNNDKARLTETFLDGPADICIEVVSPGSVSVDHGEKFSEYEKGGVTEYWIVDPLRDECRFYRLNEHNIYVRQPEDAQGNYTTAQLPGLRLNVAALWEARLPNPVEVVAQVQKMLNK